jgi:predicted nucleic acid-binding protein
VIVLDASAVVEMLLNTVLGERVGSRVARRGETVHAPHLLDAEVLHAVRRLCATGEVPEERGLLALADLADLPIVRYVHTDLVARAWALRASVTAYDGMYVALAEALDAPVVTCDGRLGRAHGHRAKVEVLE